MPIEKLSKIDDQLEKLNEKRIQRHRQKKLQENREKTHKQKIDTRRKILIGDCVLKCFPAASQFQPQRTQAENKKEFEKLDVFLSLLSENTGYITKLNEQAEQILMKNG